MNLRYFLVLLFLVSIHCRSTEDIRLEQSANTIYRISYSTFKSWLDTLPLAREFDFALCKPHGVGCYDAQPFTVSDHLGEDWNRAANNKDLGEPVYSIGEGVVVFADDVGGGWGKVLRVIHRTGESGKQVYVEALYAHFTAMYPRPGDIVQRGQKIGTLGTAGGIYEAHLHLELRSIIGLPIGGGYSAEKKGFLDPKKFIRAHRP